MKKHLQVLVRALFLVIFVVAQTPALDISASTGNTSQNQALPATAGLVGRFALSNPGPALDSKGSTIASARDYLPKEPATSQPYRGLFGLKFAAPSSASTFQGGLEIEPITAYNLIVDSNVLAPSSYGPNAATVGARFCNRSGSTMNNVIAYIGDYDAVPANRTPGVYPIITPAQAATNTGNGALAAAQYTDFGGTVFSLKHESGTTPVATDATRVIGTLTSGQCVTQYWLISYPRKAWNGSAWIDVTGGVKPDDDLWLPYDFWATNGAGNTSFFNRYVTMRNEISAMANKIWPNGDNKVPDEYVNAIQQVLGWSTWIPGSSSNVAYPGDTVTSQGIWYDLGNVGAGFDNNYDLVPDRNAWLQPIGDAAAYDAGCFRLVRTYGLLVVKLATGGTQLIPFVDQLYFEGLPGDNTGAVGLVFYEYTALDGVCTAGLTPYQEVASGYDNEKFNADFGAGIPPISSRQSNMTVDKTGNTTVALGGTINYTMTFTLPDIDNTANNFQTVTVGNPSNGTALTFYDIVPIGEQYVACSAYYDASLNPNKYPAVCPLGTFAKVSMTNYATNPVNAEVWFSTNGGTTWTQTDPAGYTSSSTANQLHIKWKLTQGITSPASGAAVTGTVGFSSVVPLAYTGSNVITNNVCLKIGDSGPPADGVSCDPHITIVTGSSAIQGTVWADDGKPSGTLGDGVINGTEVGIANVKVSLYWDGNGDGDYADAVDFLYGTTNTFGTGTTLNYCFDGTPGNGTCTVGAGGLPPTSGSARYILVVDKTDADIPTGYGPSTTTIYTGIQLAVNDLYGDGPVTTEPSDFGFTPALSIQKRRDTPSPVTVGAQVQFTLTVRNDLPGSGTPSNACVYNVWSGLAYPTSAGTPPGGNAANARFQNPNAAVGSPDDNYAFSNISDNTDLLGFSSFAIGNQGAAITKVESIAYVRERADLAAGDSVVVHTWYNNAEIAAAADTYAGTFFASPVGTKYILAKDITATRAWTWNDFGVDTAGNVAEMQFEGRKSGNTTGDIEIDAIGFRITTNGICDKADSTLNPVPLIDIYDTTYLRFVSADPPITSGPVSAGGTNNQISWSNVGPLYAGQIKYITVTFQAVATTPTNTTNYDETTGAYFASGIPANSDLRTEPDNQATVVIQAANNKSLSGRIFDDNTTTGWQGGQWTEPGTQVGYDANDIGIGNIPIDLFVCVDATTNLIITAPANNKPCSDAAGNNGASWVYVSTTASAPYAIIDGRLDLNNDGNATNDNGTASGCTVTNGLLSGCTNYGVFSVNGGGFIDANRNGTFNEGTDNFLRGAYIFPNLANGFYYVDVHKELISGPQTADVNENLTCAVCDSRSSNPSTDNLSANPFPGDLVNNATGTTNVNFGYNVGTGTFNIGDTIFYDWNGDGIQTPSVDEGIPNVTVQLLGADGSTVIATTTTNTSGNYLFSGYAPSNYTVRVVASSLPAGVIQTADPDGAIMDNESTFSITTADKLDRDFGYRPTGSGQLGDTVFRDMNGDGTQGSGETGISGVTVQLLVDLNNDGLWVVVSSQVTTSTGYYLFTGLPAGTYRVLVDRVSNSAAIPNDGFGNDYIPSNLSSDTSFTNVNPVVYFTKTLLTATSSVLTADFAFAPPASIGDTVYLDLNGNATQDYNEPGIPGVTVTLYTFVDANNNSKFDVGETLTSTGQTKITDSDGVYNFTGLQPGYYAVVVTPPPGSTLTGDPSADGFTCQELNNPADPNEPSSLVCDHTDGQRLYNGTNYTGADFGYQLPGNFGDALWIDANNNGRYDAGETGIPDITVTAVTGTNVTVNGVNYPAGTTLTTITDANGYYSFTGITPVGVPATWVVTVNTADPDFPAGLTNTYDPDGVNNSTTQVVMSIAGAVTSVGGCVALPNGCDGETDPLRLDADFGYRFVGTTNISGTVCLETTVDGVCGDNFTDPSGVGGGETAFTGVTVYLYKLIDANNNQQLDPGETTVLVTSTSTNVNGDYSFTGLADGAGTYYVIAIGAPMSGLNLTSDQTSVNTGGDGSQTTDYNETTAANGDTISTNQVVNATATGTNIVDRDFAFNLNGTYDFGDNPVSYSVRLDNTPDGPRHLQPVGGFTRYLGVIPDTESNGQPTADATGDGNDEDGVWYSLLDPNNQDPNPNDNIGIWEDGNGTLRFNIVGGGYLVGWIDWNNDGDFNDALEMVVSRSVSAGNNQAFDFVTPTGAGTVPAGNYFMRFRLFASQPGIPALAYSGPAINGEVEDYRVPIGITPVTLSYFQAGGAGGSVSFNWSTAMESGNLGFNLYDSQMNRLNGGLIASKSADAMKRQDYSFKASSSDTSFYIEDVSVGGETRLHGPFSLGQTYGDRTSAAAINWSAARAETDASLRVNDNPALVISASSAGVSLKVSKTGLYRVTYEALLNAGFDFSNVLTRDLKLTNSGAGVPMYVYARGIRFGAGGYIEFYGQALDTLYTGTNVYQLAAGSGGARTSNALVAANRLVAPPASFNDTLTVNNQNAYATYAPGNDPWYDNYMMVGNTPDHWDSPFTVTNLANASAPATMKLTLWGLTQWPADNDHHVLVSINGTQVGDLSFDGFSEGVFDLNIPGNVLQNGANTLRLTLAGDRGVDYDVVSLDKFTITYQRSFKAVDGSLIFTASGKNIEVTNLPTSNVVAYRIDPTGVTRITRLQATATGATFKVNFAGTAAPAKYVVSTVEALNTPSFEAARQPSGLDTPARYLIISHPNFLGGLSALVSARQAQGFTVNTVDVRDIYARYAGGNYNPKAIQQYIGYAEKNLGTQYVLIIGGDTADYRNYISSSISFVPSLYTKTGTYDSFVPSDALFADVDGDLAPEVAIGRFPVRTNAELSAMIQKTLAYGSRSGDYAKSAVIVADKFDGEASYKAHAYSIASALPSDWTTQNIFLDDMSVGAANTQLLGAMNGGTSLVFFTGHSAPGQWTFPAVFNSLQASNLTNAGKSFVAVQWGCWDNYYVDPSYNYLTQSLLLSGDRGAAATLGVVMRGNAQSEVTFSQVLTPRLMTNGMTLGQAIQLSKIDVANANPYLLDMLYGFTLMGDPALVIQP